MSTYQGDVAFKINQEGSSFKFIEGQPVMDGGFENAVLISLFTKPNWAGNEFLTLDSQKIGSDFLDSMNLPINLEGLNRRRDAASKSLEWAKQKGLFQDVFVEVTNPNSNTILVNIRITPPNGADVDLTLENVGANWRIQRDDPAHRGF